MGINIKKDKQIWKFCFYGFFKNLKFFEPYLIVYLLSMGLNYIDIGGLIALKEIIIYIFEIPSGVIADIYGKKKELVMCFIFYIISFILFFFGKGIFIISIGMIFYGLGEAFRSGTHKAMILEYLDVKGWTKHKSLVYGRTRSFSLLGSAISALLSIVFILNMPSMKWIFLLSIVPYVLDMILIISYPRELDRHGKCEFNIIFLIKESIVKLRYSLCHKEIRQVIVGSSIYTGVMDVIKDYIQPILKAMILLTFVGNSESEGDIYLKISLGLIYFVFNIFSSVGSRNAYRLNKFLKSENLLNIYFVVTAIVFLILSFGIKLNSYTLIILCYFVIFILKNTRKPFMLDVLGELVEKDSRASVLSVNSQLKSLVVIVLAPVMGFIAEYLQIEVLFIVCALMMMLCIRVKTYKNIFSRKEMDKDV
ncbi:MFS transporter [Oceanirhabdus sp. W0125-5]|uniref:MFS transporter n=1 Tax=Oceanirhabdus sp. W0125-5 TaxID=2999116 RepID=UPI0022F2E6E5|nr:MFS transporter [Oceanirhabdus sp. W0125-5]WBW99261.1 MFS transporter [Oceanirhabdus sp. W0125-5]